MTNTEHLATLADRLREHVDTLDGVVHSIGFAPQEAMGEGFPEVPWEPVATAFQVSTWSMASLTQACRPLFGEHGLGRRAHLRRDRRLAGLRLDGPGQGGAGGDQSATSPASSAPRVSGSTSSPPARCAAWR